MHIGRPRNESEQASALRQLLRIAQKRFGAGPEDEAESLARSNRIDLSGLVGAWERSVAIAAGLFLITPDGSSLVWPVEASEQHQRRDAIAAALMQEIATLMDRAGCPYAQALVEVERSDQREALEQSGFRYLTDLLFLECPLRHRPFPQTATEDGRVIHFTEADSARFAATIERTYLGSQDCPAFAGIRTATDALNSYRAAGEFVPEQWWLLEQEGRDVATILVNNRFEERSREIVYLGVTPEARGAGIGRRLLTRAIAQAIRDELESVHVSVDSANEPARRLYKEAGFLPREKRAVFVRHRGERRG